MTPGRRPCGGEALVRPCPSADRASSTRTVPSLECTAAAKLRMCGAFPREACYKSRKSIDVAWTCNIVMDGSSGQASSSAPCGGTCRGHGRRRVPNWATRQQTDGSKFRIVTAAGSSECVAPPSSEACYKSRKSIDVALEEHCNGVVVWTSPRRRALTKGQVHNILPPARALRLESLKKHEQSQREIATLPTSTCRARDGVPAAVRRCSSTDVLRARASSPYAPRTHGARVAWSSVHTIVSTHQARHAAAACPAQILIATVLCAQTSRAPRRRRSGVAARAASAERGDRLRSLRRARRACGSRDASLKIPPSRSADQGRSLSSRPRTATRYARPRPPRARFAAAEHPSRRRCCSVRVWTKRATRLLQRGERGASRGQCGARAAPTGGRCRFSPTELSAAVPLPPGCRFCGTRRRRAHRDATRSARRRVPRRLTSFVWSDFGGDWSAVKAQRAVLHYLFTVSKVDGLPPIARHYVRREAFIHPGP